MEIPPIPRVFIFGILDEGSVNTNCQFRCISTYSSEENHVLYLEAQTLPYLDSIEVFVDHARGPIFSGIFRQRSGPVDFRVVGPEFVVDDQPPWKQRRTHSNYSCLRKPLHKEF